MRFSYWPAPTMPWADLLEMSRHVEATGWDGIWYADHFMPNGDDTSAPLEPKPVQNPLPLMIGGVSEIVDAVGAYREAGVHEFIVPAFNLGGKDRQKEVLDQFIEEVAPGFR